MNNIMTMSKSLSASTSNEMSRIKPKKETLIPLFLIIFYLFLEYVRPQLVFPALKYLHLPMLTVVFIAISIFISGKIFFHNRQTILFLLFLFEMVIHGPFAKNNYWALQIFYTMTITFIIYVGIINIVDEKFKYEILIKYWVIISIILSVIGIINKGGGLGGFLGDENDFCMTMNMALPFGIFGLITANKKIEKFYFLFLTLLFMGSIIQYSRGGFVGLVSVIIYCWFKSKSKIVFSFIIGILLVFALIAAPVHYFDRIQTITTEYNQNKEGTSIGTGAQRIYAWKIGWRIFLENPLIGVGQGNYPWYVGEFEEKMGVQWQTRSLSGRAAHSLYFTLLPELGVIGTFLYVSIIVFVFKDLKYIKIKSKYNKNILSVDESKRFYNLALTLEGSLVGFLISSIFISTLYYPNFWILCGFIVSLKKIMYTKCECQDVKHSNYSIKYST